MERAIIWSSSVVVASAIAVTFLFLTFQTTAAADKASGFFDARLTRMEQKIDQILENIK